MHHAASSLDASEAQIRRSTLANTHEALPGSPKDLTSRSFMAHGDAKDVLDVVDGYFRARAENSEAALAALCAPGLFIGPPGNPIQLRDHARRTGSGSHARSVTSPSASGRRSRRRCCRRRPSRGSCARRLPRDSRTESREGERAARAARRVRRRGRRARPTRRGRRRRGGSGRGRGHVNESTSSSCSSAYRPRPSRRAPRVRRQRRRRGRGAARRARLARRAPTRPARSAGTARRRARSRRGRRGRAASGASVALAADELEGGHGADPRRGRRDGREPARARAARARRGSAARGRPSSLGAFSARRSAARHLPARRAARDAARAAARPRRRGARRRAARAGLPLPGRAAQRRRDGVLLVARGGDDARPPAATPAATFPRARRATRFARGSAIGVGRHEPAPAPDRARAARARRGVRVSPRELRGGPLHARARRGAAAHARGPRRLQRRGRALYRALTCSAPTGRADARGRRGARRPVASLRERRRPARPGRALRRTHRRGHEGDARQGGRAPARRSTTRSSRAGPRAARARRTAGSTARRWSTSTSGARAPMPIRYWYEEFLPLCLRAFSVSHGVRSARTTPRSTRPRRRRRARAGGLGRRVVRRGAGARRVRASARPRGGLAALEFASGSRRARGGSRATPQRRAEAARARERRRPLHGRPLDVCAVRRRDAAPRLRRARRDARELPVLPRPATWRLFPRPPRPRASRPWRGVGERAGDRRRAQGHARALSARVACPHCRHHMTMYAFRDSPRLPLSGRCSAPGLRARPADRRDDHRRQGRDHHRRARAALFPWKLHNAVSS